MIETVVFNYLIDQDIERIGTNVFMEVPEKPPKAYIVVDKTGSGRENRINRATFAIQSISKTSKLEAAEINEAVKEVMDRFAEESSRIYSCRLDTDYHFSNPQTKEYRYQAVYNIFY